MENLTAALENILVFRDKETNQILAVETQNGHLERYDCLPTNHQRTNQLFGADRPPEKVKLQSVISDQGA
jgi:hypothetical protein